MQESQARNKAQDTGEAALKERKDGRLKCPVAISQRRHPQKVIGAARRSCSRGGAQAS